MTRLLRPLFAVAAALLTVFLLGAFVLWDLDPSRWTEASRFFVALFGAALSIVAAAVSESLP